MKNLKFNNVKVFYITLCFAIYMMFLHYAGFKSWYNADLFFTTPKNGWKSIFTGAFMHRDIVHLFGNLSSLVLTIPLILVFYKKDFWKLTVLGLFLPYVFAYFYFLGIPTRGLSALVYCNIYFLIASGLGSKDTARFIVAIILLALEASTMRTFARGVLQTFQTYNIIPMLQAEIHGAGAVVGIAYAIFRYHRNYLKTLIKKIWN